MSRSAAITLGENGITAAVPSANSTVSGGARRNSHLSALAGTMLSFCSSFSASANGCRSPAGPTSVGPRRLCMRPENLRSNQIDQAVIVIRTVTITRPYTAPCRSAPPNPEMPASAFTGPPPR